MTDHVWSGQQEAALKAVSEWLKDPNSQVFKLFGYAGTGKTTLAKHLAAHIEGQVLFAAFTGKAASVLRDAGCPNAQTLHSLLYHVRDNDRRELQRLADLLHGMDDRHPDYAQTLAEHNAEQARVRGPRFQLNPDSYLKDAALLVVDEVSMVNGAMGKDILSFGKKVLVLGDPAQLPPVTGGGFFTTGKPDILLSEIHRQAADNPIVRWATMVRRGEVVPYGDLGLARKMRRTDINDVWLTQTAGQLLCGKNETRAELNQRIRRQLGHKGAFPANGERLVCLKNNHKLGLLNGEVCMSAGAAVYSEEYPFSITQGVRYNGAFMRLEMDAGIFRTGVADATRRLEQFDYGYALTVHKAQGSQWPTVTVYDDGFAKREATERQRWLYTAITRAQTQLYIVTS